jgi:hypothetical protein
VAKRSRTRPAPPDAGGGAAAGTRRGSSRRTAHRAHERTLLERYGSWLLLGLVALGVVVIGYVALSSANQVAYACSSELTPGPTEPNPTPFPPSPTPSPSPTANPSASPTATANPSPTAEPTPVPEPTARLGFTTSDLGRTHVTGTVTYGFCPPTSGNHYIINGQAPMQPAVYGPAQERSPAYWVHNLEHGFVVLAYRCPSGVLGSGDCPTQDEFNQLQAWYDQAPKPTLSQCPTKVLVVRFDSMDTRFALLAWDRALLMNTFDLNQALTFAQQWMDAPTTPEFGAC